MSKPLQTGEFGTIYPQFKDKPKEAIKHLIKVQTGECPKALYRADIGYIDIVWGENNPKTNKGFGLKHIIEKHGKEIKQLGFNIENFVPIIVQYGELKSTTQADRISLEGKMFRIIIAKIAYKDNKKIKKTFVLTSFDLRPLEKKNRQPDG
jgi:hypothetical protein